MEDLVVKHIKIMEDLVVKHIKIPGIYMPLPIGNHSDR
jgi:hypothetical protein